MSLLETFFAFAFVSTFSVMLLATWLGYVPTLITFYRNTAEKWHQPSLEKFSRS